MKILIINQHFHPEVASSGQIMTELAVDLVRAGHRVGALTGRASYRPIQQQDARNPETGNIITEEEQNIVGYFVYFLSRILPKRVLELDQYNGVNIIRTYLYSPILSEGRFRMVQRVIQYLTFFLTSFIIALLMPRYDAVIYLSTPPLLNGITGLALKIFKKTANIYNIQDLYPDVAVKLGAVKNEFVIKVCSMVEKMLYRHAAAIVPVGEKMCRQLIEKGVPQNKIVNIPNWMDTNLIKPLGKATPFSIQHGLKDKFVVMYSGNMGLSQGLEIVLYCAKITHNMPILYLLIGGGANREGLENLAQELNLDNVKFMNYQPKERLSESFGAGDVHLVMLKRGLSAYSMPSKFYGILASGKPIIASVDKDSELAIMVEKVKCGLVLEPEDPKALANAIISLYNDRQKIETFGKNGRIYLERVNTREICTGRYLDLIKRVTA